MDSVRRLLILLLEGEIQSKAAAAAAQDWTKFFNLITSPSDQLTTTAGSRIGGGAGGG